MPATFSLPHLLVFSIILCLLSSSSSLPPLLPSSHISLHSPPISALASLVSSCPAIVTLPLSSVIGHRLSFLRIQPTVICSWPVSLSSSSALLLVFGPSCFRTLAAFVVVVRSVPMFPFRTGKLVWHKCSWPCPSVYLRSAGPPLPPQLLSMRSLRPVLFDVPLSPSSSLRTLPLLGTRNCPVVSVSSPPARCPALPFGGLCAALLSSLVEYKL